MDSLTASVVFPNGISVIDRVFLSIFSIFARTLIFPPFFLLLYFEQSAEPPVRKSGKISKSLPSRTQIEASISSLKL